MEIKTVEIAGFAPALQGMRAPMNSWKLSDSEWIYNDVEGLEYNVGEKDLKLAMNLTKAGTEHAKFLRMIQVWATVDMPRYWWSEADTYKFGTKNSCSTMHRLLHKTTEITLDCFYYNQEDEDVMIEIIKRLNEIRETYLNTTNAKEQHELIARAKRLLPEGFLQLRYWNTNYAELRNIYHQRKHHKLKAEWQDVFCEWVKTLPCSELITEDFKVNKEE